MRRSLGAIVATVVAICVVSATAAVAQPAPDPCEVTRGRSITYVGVTPDQTDFEAADVGRSGYWFPQFDAPAPVIQRPTGENTRDSLPGWIAPFSNFPEDPDFGARTFSQDGPARSTGGQTGWNTFTLPDGEVGRSGAIVDPATVGNTNNTVNRIVLRGEVPATFYLHIVTDNTDGGHDPTVQIRARGNIGPQDRDDTQVEPDTWPTASDLDFDGTADTYTFRFDGFQAGDYLKIRLAGAPAPATGASFGGLLFDETFAADTTPPAAACPEPEPTPSTSVPDAHMPVRPPSHPGSPPARAALPIPGDPTFTG